MFFITSSTLETSESKRFYEKTVFVELDFKKDSVLFLPYSKAWNTNWNLSSDLLSGGSSLMNYDKYKSAFENRMDNLWTVLHPMIIENTVTSYYPYDPESYGLSGVFDEGEMRYPITNQEENETFLTSEKVRDGLSYLLGRYGPEQDFPLLDDYGDALIIILADGTEAFAYPPRDYQWYKDSDIVKYKLRVSILVNKKGKEIKRIIRSISPVTYIIDDEYEIEGEKDMIWLDFEELKPHLKEVYYLDGNDKPIFYLDHILEKVKNADI